MKIGVMGGTFNPIHLAHLISAEQIRQGLALDQVLFIPSARPPHKSPDGIVAVMGHHGTSVTLTRKVT